MYDNSIDINGKQAYIKVATVSRGIVQFRLNGDAMSYDEQQELYALLQSQGVPENDAAVTVEAEVKMREIHAQIIDVCNSESRWTALVQEVGDDPSQWLQKFCHGHGIVI